MDPIAHTLFGAALAESGLKHRSRYATATLLIGANLPDIDVVSGLWGGDVALLFRRGMTHGVLAVLLLPLLLTGAMWVWQRWRGHARVQVIAAPDAVPFRPRAILALAFLAVLSHPLLDWLNTYGVRLLMPFDTRWFYGDALFIVDPWFWLLTAAGVVLHWRKPAWGQSRHVARAGLATLLLYVGTAYGLARMAESKLALTFAGAQQVQANPMPGNILSHRVVIAERDLYRIVTPEGEIHELQRRQPDAVVRTALAAESIRGFANWVRFPVWTVEETPEHWIVRIQDLRYQGPDSTWTRGIGAAEVAISKAGAPVVQGGTPSP